MKKLHIHIPHGHGRKHGHGHGHHHKHGHSHSHTHQGHAPHESGGRQATPEQMQEVQDFNKEQPYTQGNRLTFSSGANSAVTIQLLTPGRWLYGIQVLPSATGTDVSDVAVTFVINNLNILVGVSAQVLNPTKLLGFLYYPTPQPLIGTDNIQVSLNSQSGVSGSLYFEMFYIPRK